MDPAAPGSQPPADADPAASVRALVARLAEEFGADLDSLTSVASLYAEIRERAPDLFVPTAGPLALALGENGAGGERIFAALAEWVLDAESEPIERMRSDCQRFQGAMSRGALRLHAANPERCAERLLALQRLVFLQVALLASVAARGQGEGGVVRTLPTPEYAAFMESLRTAIAEHRQEGKQLGVLVIQVSRIEQVDRLLGLQKGEAFMLRVIRRMREGVLRRQDQLGRVSRGQLACLLPRIAGEGVAILAANKILGALEMPIPIGERSFSPDVSIGIAMYPAHADNPEALVRNGKLAARAARAASEQVLPYDPSHGESEERAVRHEMRLRRSLEENALALAFEPQVDVASGRVAGLEVRVRWTDAELGEVPEARMRQAAESAGLDLELTRWTINNALRQAEEFAGAGVDLPLRLNVAGNILVQPDFPDFLDRALRTWSVASGRLIIEIDEGALAGEHEPLDAAMQRLKALGLGLAVDGFGASASSLGNLARLPFDELKIGALFACDMQRDPVHARIVRALVHLGLDLGLAVSAEGVEDAQAAATLAALGCARVQGGVAGAPVTAQEIVARHRSGI